MYFWAAPFVLVAFFILLILGIVPYCIFRIVCLKKFAQAWLGCFNRIVSRFIIWILGIDYSVSIDEESLNLIRSNKPVCFTANHTSFLDIPFVLCSVRGYLGFVMKKSIAFFPVVNLVAISMGCIFIDRSSREKSIEGIRKGVKRVKRGDSFLIFPEGTRSKTGSIGDFKHGSFRLAFEADVPVIPVVIKGVRQAFEDRTKCFARCKAQLCVLKPVLIKESDERSERFEKIESIESSIRETYASLGV